MRATSGARDREPAAGDIDRLAEVDRDVGIQRNCKRAVGRASADNGWRGVGAGTRVWRAGRKIAGVVVGIRRAVAGAYRRCGVGQRWRWGDFGAIGAAIADLIADIRARWTYAIERGGIVDQ